MSNLRPAPLFLTPQVVRGVLGIGHPKRVVELPVEGRVNAADKAAEAANPAVALPVRAKVKTVLLEEIRQEIAAVFPLPPQSRDGALSSPEAVVVPAPIHPVMDAAAMLDDGKPNATRQERAAKRRVAAAVPASSETAGTAALDQASSPSLPLDHARQAEAVASEESTLDEDRTPLEDSKVSSGPTTTAELSESPSVRELTGVVEAAVEGVAISPQSVASISKATGSHWIANRFERIAAAIAYLKTKCILVQVIDRDELVKRYRVTGKRYPHDIATGLGWAG